MTHLNNEWKFIEAFPIFSSNDNTLFTKMDNIRESITCTLDDRIKYCQFWICIASILTARNINTCSKQLWFTMDGFETDCYWVELLFHLSRCLSSLYDVLIATKSEVTFEAYNVPQIMLQLKKLIGCCAYFESEGLQFDALEGDYYALLKQSYANMIEKKNKVRLLCLRMLAYTAENDNKTKECIIFCTACVEEDKSMIDMRVMLARACSSLALQQGLFGEAIALLSNCPELSAEANVLKDALSSSYNEAATHSPLQVPKASQKLFAKGDSPLTTKLYTHLLACIMPESL